MNKVLATMGCELMKPLESEAKPDANAEEPPPKRTKVQEQQQLSCPWSLLFSFWGQRPEFLVSEPLKSGRSHPDL